MKSVKKIAVAALTFCAVATMGIAAQAAPYGHNDARDTCRHQPRAAAVRYAGDRHMRHGWMHRGNLYRQEKFAGIREIRRFPALCMRVAIPGHHRWAGCFGHRFGHRYMAKLNLTQDQKTRIKSIKRETRAKIEAVKSDNSLTRDARKDKIMSIFQSARGNVRAVLTPEQLQKLDAARQGGQKNEKS